MSSNPSHPHGHGYGQRSSAGHPGYAQSNEEVAAWINALSSQEHALDPRIYSDGQHPQQYVAGGYPSGGYPAGSVAPGAYPPSSYPATATYSTTPQQYPSGYYHPPYPAGSYPAAFQQGASGMQPYAPQMAQQQPPRQHQYQMQPQQQYQQQYSPSFDAGMGEEYDDYSASESESTEAGRARSRIPLDPNQPLTVEGRQRERVNVACDRCRVRKLRCDGAQPECYNCQRVEGVQCHYDPHPKRRGQDKAQRTRSAVGHRKPRRPAVRKDSNEPGASGSGSRAY